MEFGEERQKKEGNSGKLFIHPFLLQTQVATGRIAYWRKYKETLLIAFDIAMAQPFPIPLVLSHVTGSCLCQRLEAGHSSCDWCNFGFFFLFLVSWLLFSPEISPFSSAFSVFCSPPLPLPHGLSLPDFLADGKFNLMPYSFRCNIYHSVFYFCDSALVTLHRIFLFISTAFRNMVTRFLSCQHIILPHKYIYIAYLFRSYCTFWVRSMLSSIKSCTWHLENGAFAFLAFSLLFHFWTPSIA